MSSQLPFIPAWLDELRLNQAEFRLYCHLCRRADKNGIAWPSVDGKESDGKSSRTSIVSVCGMARRTAWKTINRLIDLELIEKLGKRHFQSSNYYRVLVPTGSNKAPVEVPIIPFEAPIDDSPIDANAAPSFGANGTLPLTQTRPREGSPKKEIQGRKSTHDDFFTDEIGADPKRASRQEMAESIYQEYPKKTAKSDALRAITKAMKGTDPNFLLERTKAYAAAIGWKDKQYIPYPATWFNKGMYNDEPSEWKQPNGQSSKPTAPVNTGRRTSNIEEI